MLLREASATIYDCDLDVRGCGPYSMIVVERKVLDRPIEYFVSVRKGLLCLKLFGPFTYEKAVTFAEGAEAFAATLLVTGRIENA